MYDEADRSSHRGRGRDHDYYYEDEVHARDQWSQGYPSGPRWPERDFRGRSSQQSPISSTGQPPHRSPPFPSFMASDGLQYSRSRDGSSFERSSQAEDEEPRKGSGHADIRNMLPPDHEPGRSGFSFALKSKPGPTSIPKPVPDMKQRMQSTIIPPRRAVEPPQRPMEPPTAPRSMRAAQFGRRDRFGENSGDRGGDRDRYRDNRRDMRGHTRGGGFRGSRDGRDGGHDFQESDWRFDHDDKGWPTDFYGEQFEHRHQQQQRHIQLQQPSPEQPQPPGEQNKITAISRPTLPEEYASSDSVYYRKPGNESVIGAGTYGKVFKAVHIYTRKEVALKRIRMEGEKDGFPVTAVREIKLLQHLRSHNVVSLLEVMVEKNECFMVFEYLSHDLTGLINHPSFVLKDAHKKDLAKQMFEGLNYLHRRGVLHRDLKAANILVSNSGLLKFADFGLARFFSKSHQLDYTNRVITIWYRPPELLLGETKYGPSVDLWSAACVYIEMFTKKAVFPGDGGEISQLNKLYSCLGTPSLADWPDMVQTPWFELMRPTERRKRVFEERYRDILSPAALDLMGQIFRYDPAKRPTSEEILAHPYFVSEEPRPQQAVEYVFSGIHICAQHIWLTGMLCRLENIVGDWHEFESKTLRKERDKEARRRAEYMKEKEKRKAIAAAESSDQREAKRAKPNEGEQGF